MLVYSFVARGNNVLADYTSYTGRDAPPIAVGLPSLYNSHCCDVIDCFAAGNFATVAIQCLDKLSYDKVRQILSPFA